MTDTLKPCPKRSEVVDAGIKELAAAFIDVTLHAQTAFKIVDYIKGLEAAVRAASKSNQEES